MGALLGGNADRQWGYKIGDKIVPPAIDKIDGGGPGRSGPTFEGGGLLSDIGNALMRPYGYRDRMQAVRPQMRPPGLLSAPPTPPSATEPNYADRFAPPQALATEPNYADRFGSYTPPAPLMSQAYYNRLVQLGIAPENITQVGQPMTMDERLEMSKYMPDAPSPVVATEANYADRRGTYPVVRPAAAAPAPAPTIPGDLRRQFVSYLMNAQVDSSMIEAIMSLPAETLQKFLVAFERDGVLPETTMEQLR